MLCKIRKDGKSTSVYFFNGDVKHLKPDQTVVSLHLLQWELHTYNQEVQSPHYQSSNQITLDINLLSIVLMYDVVSMQVYFYAESKTTRADGLEVLTFRSKLYLKTMGCATCMYMYM